MSKQHDPLRDSNVARIAAILSSFLPDNRRQTVSDMLDGLGIKRSTGLALVRVLISRGYLQRSGRGAVELGATARQLSFAPLENRYGTRSAPTRIRAIAKRPDPQARQVDLLGSLDPDLMRSVPEGKYARGGPWVLGFSNASLSNFWRKAFWRSLEYGVAVRAADIKHFHVRHGSDDPEQQAVGIQDLIECGIDALVVSSAPDPNGQVARALSRAKSAGLPVVAVDRLPKHQAAVSTFVTASDHMIGRVSALWIAEKLLGQGEIWMLSGVQDSSPAQRRASSAREIFSAFQGLAVSAHHFTSWTEHSGFEAVSELLSRGASVPDAVWCDSGLQGLGSMKAFEQAGLPIPPHTGGELNGMYRYVLEHGVPHCALDYPAAMGAQSVSVALDLLRGRPVARRVETPVPVILPRGEETLSVKADVWAERHVQWDMGDDVVLSQGAALRGPMAVLHS